MYLKKIATFFIDMRNVNKKGEEYENGLISYRNWWKNNSEEQWFTIFLNENAISLNKKIRFYSIFGSCSWMKKTFNGITIFYTGENLTTRKRHTALVERKEKVAPLDYRIKKYEKHIRNANVDLVMTFNTEGIENAIRFPYWIISHFTGCYTIDDVRNRLNGIEEKYHEIDLSRKGAAVVSSHDFFGTRASISDSIKEFVDIEYAGIWRHNTDRLKRDYKNNKRDYLSNFRFNICPENMDAKEYVTEKIWDSFEAGCIPIYGGALGNPEPEIFNKEAFILWSFDGDNTDAINAIRNISQDDDYYSEIKKRNVFIDGADEYIYSLIEGFRKALNSLG